MVPLANAPEGSAKSTPSVAVFELVMLASPYGAWTSASTWLRATVMAVAWRRASAPNLLLDPMATTSPVIDTETSDRAINVSSSVKPREPRAMGLTPLEFVCAETGADVPQRSKMWARWQPRVIPRLGGRVRRTKDHECRYVFLCRYCFRRRRGARSWVASTHRCARANERAVPAERGNGPIEV